MPQGVVNSYMANGTVLPYSFVKFDATAPYKVIQATAVGDLLLGVSQEYTNSTPLPSGGGTNAAVAGEQLRVYRVGARCLLKIGAGGCTNGQYLTSDASGNGVTAVATNIAGAIARDTRAVGELCPVEVIDPIKM